MSGNKTSPERAESSPNEAGVVYWMERLSRILRKKRLLQVIVNLANFFVADDVQMTIVASQVFLRTR